jgi:hypothetical protein
VKKEAKSLVQVNTKESAHTWWTIVAPVTYDNVYMGTKAWQDSRCETKMAPQGHFPAISALDHVGPGNLNTASKTRNWLEPLAQRSNRLSAEFDDLIQALRRLRYRLPEYIQLLFTDRFRCLTWKMPKSGVHLNENVFLLNVVTDPSFDIYIYIFFKESNWAVAEVITSDVMEGGNTETLALYDRFRLPFI